jgi:ribonuclease P protein component
MSIPKNEKLKSEKCITQLFNEGSAITVFPLRLVFLETTFEAPVKVKVGVSVGKRKFKTAVDRNRIKRLIREAYRLNKGAYFNNITTQFAFMILYIGNEKPSYIQTETAMKQMLKKFVNKVTSKED